LRKMILDRIDDSSHHVRDFIVLMEGSANHHSYKLRYVQPLAKLPPNGYPD
jgi:hypothetical protein